MDLDESSNHLREYLLHFLQRKSAMIDEVIIQFVTCGILAFVSLLLVKALYQDNTPKLAKQGSR